MSKILIIDTGTSNIKSMANAINHLNFKYEIINTDKKGNAWWIFNSILRTFDSPIYVLTCDNVTNIDFKKIERGVS